MSSLAVGKPVDDPCEQARSLLDRGEYDAAIEGFARALARDPRSRDAVWGLAEAWHYKGVAAEARRWYGRYLELVPGHAEAAHMVLALGGGVPPPRAGDGYVRALFDNFADSFDGLLVDELSYRAPALLYAAVASVLPAGAGALNVLDLGCGTGLAGAAFRRLARHLAGVDLSREMVKRALARGVYDALRVAEAGRFLATTRARYDLIVAADVLVYFGDLAPLVTAAAGAVAPGGHLAFTVEVAPGGDVELAATGRYRHHPDHVGRAAAAAGLDLLCARPEVLRTESGTPVDGLVAVCRRM